MKAFAVVVSLVLLSCTDSTVPPPDLDVVIVAPSGAVVVNGEVTFEMRLVGDVARAVSSAVSSDLDGLLCSPALGADDVGRCAAVMGPGIHILTFSVLADDGTVVSASRELDVRTPQNIDDDGDGLDETGGDCDDERASTHPGALEVANGVDDDCDGLVDDGLPGTDDDGDGLSEASGDCDDARADVHPGATELDNDIDDDCDGVVDDGLSDNDGDGATEVDGDCDDADPAIHPSAAEICNARDDDCDFMVDDAITCTDSDLDGWFAENGDCNDNDRITYPGQTSDWCDWADNDCDGVVDESLGMPFCDWKYPDLDGDGRGAGVSECVCPVLWEGRVGRGGDCDDNDPTVSPAQETFFTVPRANGSFDYDCDGNETQEHTTLASCAVTLTEPGWLSQVPACGTDGVWSETAVEGAVCVLVPDSIETQGCR